MPLRKTVACVATVLLAGSLASACSSSGSAGNSDSGGAESAYASFSAMSGQAREDALVAAAKKEGSLLIYSSNTDMQKTLVPAFEKKYGINVKVYRATNEAVTTRALQEGQNGRTVADVVENDQPNMDALIAAKLLAEYKSQVRDAMPETAKFKYWTATRYTVTLMVRNTKLVPEDKMPKTFADLAKPEWKGKIALESSDYAWYLSIYKYFKDKGMSDEEFTKMFKGIAANARSVSGHPDMTALIESGDVAISPDDYTQYVVKDAPKGAPISFTPIVGPVFEDPLGVGVMKDAPHPAAALLFCDWYLGTDGQTLIAGLSRQPANPDAISGYKSIFPPGTEITQFDEETLSDPAKVKAWSTAYTHLLQGSGNVLP